MTNIDRFNREKDFKVHIVPASLHEEARLVITEARDDEYVRRYMVRRLAVTIPCILAAAIVILILTAELFGRIALSAAKLSTGGKTAVWLAFIGVWIAGTVFVILFVFSLLRREALRKKSIAEFSLFVSNSTLDAEAQSRRST